MIRKLSEDDLIEIFWMLETELAMKVAISALLGETYARVSKIISPSTGTVWSCVEIVNGKWLRVLERLSDPKQESTYISVSFSKHKTAYLAALSMLVPKIYEMWKEYRIYVSEKDWEKFEKEWKEGLYE